MLSLGGEQGACEDMLFSSGQVPCFTSVTMLMMSSNTATSVTRFLARTETLKIPKLLTGLGFNPILLWTNSVVLTNRCDKSSEY